MSGSFELLPPIAMALIIFYLWTQKEAILSFIAAFTASRSKENN